MEDFLVRMKSLLGGEYDSFLKYYEAEHFRGLRVNTLKCTPEKRQVARKQSAAPLRRVLYSGAVRDLRGRNARR